MNEENLKEFITLEDVATYLGVSMSTIYRYVHAEFNPLPTFAISGKILRVRKDDLDRWLESFKKEGKE